MIEHSVAAINVVAGATAVVALPLATWFDWDEATNVVALPLATWFDWDDVWMTEPKHVENVEVFVAVMIREAATVVNL